MSPSAGSSPRYIPRLVAVSLPSQCGFYPGIGEAVDYNALLSERHAASTEHWDGRVVVSADPDDINNLQRRQQRRTAGGAGAVTAPSSSLSSSPSCWTDLLRLPSLHAKNVLTVPPLQNEDDSFELFSEGQELVRRAQLLDAILDRVRWFAEEADALQGIQLCTDATNVSQSALAKAQAAAHTAAADGALCVAAFLLQAWGGVADGIVSELRDEYERTAVSRAELNSSSLLLLLLLLTLVSSRLRSSCSVWLSTLLSCLSQQLASATAATSSRCGS